MLGFGLGLSTDGGVVEVACAKDAVVVDQALEHAARVAIDPVHHVAVHRANERGSW